MVTFDTGARQRIVVTGAAGFVGQHLISALRIAYPKAKLIAVTRPADKFPAPLALADEIVCFDLLQTEGLAAVIAAVRPDGLVHLAAQSSVAASFTDFETSWRVNLLGTLALAEAVLKYTPACRFVLASSAEIYGLSFRGSTPLNEEGFLRPANPYACFKGGLRPCDWRNDITGARCGSFAGLQPHGRRAKR